jgi:hypothetical protein
VGQREPAADLFREALIDQVNLWVYPVVIGQRKKLFREGTAATRFEQVEPPKSYPRDGVGCRTVNT